MITQSQYVNLLSDMKAYSDFLMELQDTVRHFLYTKNISEILKEKGVKNKHTIYPEEADDLVQDVMTNYAEIVFDTEDKHLSLSKLLDLVFDLKVEHINNGDENRYAPIAYISFQDEYKRNPSKIDGFDEEDEKGTYYQEIMDDNYYYIKSNAKDRTYPSDDTNLEEQALNNQLTDDWTDKDKQDALKQMSEKEIVENTCPGDSQSLSDLQKERAYYLAMKQFVQSYITHLTPKRQERFMAMYLYVKYRQDFELQKKPSVRKENALGEKPAAFRNRKLVSRCKQDQLANHYHLIGFWEEMVAPLFANKLVYNGFDTLNKLFEKYRSSLTRNVTRVWEGERDALLKALEEKGTFDADITQEERSQIMECVANELNVRPLPGADRVLKRPKYEKNLYLHARFTESLNITCCKDYLKPLALFVRNEVVYGGVKDDDAFLQLYKEHRKNCSKCRAYEVILKRDLKHRIGRIKENIQKSLHYFYPKHTPGKQNKQLDPERLFQHYQKLCGKKPSDLYMDYLAILHKRSGRMGEFVPTADSQKKKKNRGSQLGYALEAYCICGAVKSYTLNALRFPVVNLGRQPEKASHYPHITLCQDDAPPYLAQDILQFNYNGTAWEVGVPPLQKPHFKNDSEEKACNDRQRKLAGLVFYLSKDEVFHWLQTQSKKSLPETKSIPDELWYPLSVEPKPLSSIIGIGIRLKGGFRFHGKPYAGICHPVLGRLTSVGWFIEINQNRSMATMIPSVIAKSVYK